MSITITVGCLKRCDVIISWNLPTRGDSPVSDDKRLFRFVQNSVGTKTLGQSRFCCGCSNVAPSHHCYCANAITLNDFFHLFTHLPFFAPPNTHTHTLSLSLLSQFDDWSLQHLMQESSHQHSCVFLHFQTGDKATFRLTEVCSSSPLSLINLLTSSLLMPLLFSLL